MVGQHEAVSPTAHNDRQCRTCNTCVRGQSFHPPMTCDGGPLPLGTSEGSVGPPGAQSISSWLPDLTPTALPASARVSAMHCVQGGLAVRRRGNRLSGEPAACWPRLLRP